MTEATLQIDHADLARRYQSAVQTLSPHLIAVRGLNEGERQKLTDIIRLRRKVEGLRHQSDHAALASALTAFDDAVADLPEPAVSTEKLGRFLAWVEGDKERAAPPPVPEPAPEPAADESAPTPEDHSKPERDKSNPAPQAASKPSEPLRAERPNDPKEAARPRPSWARRWMRRAAIALLFIAGVSGLRDAERREVLSRHLALDRFSLEDVAGWAGEAEWLSFSGTLGSYVASDVGNLTSATVRVAGVILREVTTDHSEPAELVVAEPAQAPVAAAPANDVAAEAVEAAVEAAAIRPQTARPAAQTRAAPGETVPRAKMDAAEAELSVLREQVRELRTQLQSLTALLDHAQQKEEQDRTEIDQLGVRLNQALAQAAIAERQGSERLQAEIARLQAENAKLRDDLYVLEDEAAEIAAITPTHQVSGTLVNARSGPGTGFQVVTTLAAGTSMILLSQSGEWGRFKRVNSSDPQEELWVFMGLTDAIRN